MEGVSEMFNKLKVKVLRLMYEYHYKKANYCLEKVEETRSDRYESEKWWEAFRYHSRLECELIDEIYQIEGI